MSVLLVLPFVFAFERVPDMSAALSAIASKPLFAANLLVCGMSFYLYNELQNKVQRIAYP